MQTIAARKRFHQHTRRRVRALCGAVVFALVALLAVAATAGASTSPPSCPGAQLRPTHANVAAVDAATLCLIDGVRRTAHLSALRPNRDLQHVAAGQSLEMVLGDFFGDDTRSGVTPLQRILASRYPKHSAAVSTAQNIGWGTQSEATPTSILAAWMSSPAHRRIILTGEFRDVGVGVTPAAPAALAQGQPGATYTVDFGNRRR